MGKTTISTYSEAFCVKCGQLGEPASFERATSDAEWHNTMQGHWVYVIHEDMETHTTTMWNLGDDGWEDA